MNAGAQQNALVCREMQNVIRFGVVALAVRETLRRVGSGDEVYGADKTSHRVSEVTPRVAELNCRPARTGPRDGSDRSPTSDDRRPLEIRLIRY